MVAQSPKGKVVFGPGIKAAMQEIVANDPEHYYASILKLEEGDIYDIPVATEEVKQALRDAYVYSPEMSEDGYERWIESLFKKGNEYRFKKGNEYRFQEGNEYRFQKGHEIGKESRFKEGNEFGKEFRFQKGDEIDEKSSLLRRMMLIKEATQSIDKLLSAPEPARTFTEPDGVRALVLRRAPSVCRGYGWRTRSCYVVRVGRSEFIMAGREVYEKLTVSHDRVDRLKARLKDYLGDDADISGGDSRDLRRRLYAAMGYAGDEAEAPAAATAALSLSDALFHAVAAHELELNPTLDSKKLMRACEATVGRPLKCDGFKAVCSSLAPVYGVWDQPLRGVLVAKEQVLAKVYGEKKLSSKTRKRDSDSDEDDGADDESEKSAVASVGDDDESEESAVASVGDDDESEQSAVAPVGDDDESEESSVASVGDDDESEESSVTSVGDDDESEESSVASVEWEDLDDSHLLDFGEVSDVYPGMQFVDPDDGERFIIYRRGARCKLSFDDGDDATYDGFWYYPADGPEPLESSYCQTAEWSPILEIRDWLARTN